MTNSLLGVMFLTAAGLGGDGKIDSINQLFIRLGGMPWDFAGMGPSLA